MAFDYNFLVGLGRAAARERQSQAQIEREQREQFEQQNQRSLGVLEKFANTPDLLPDEARSRAAQYYASLAMNPKAKPQDYEKAITEIWQLTTRPAPQTIAGNAVRRMGEMDFSFLNGMAPGLGGATNAAVTHAVPQLPTPQSINGLLTRDEVAGRDERELRRKLELQRQFAGPLSEPKATVVEGPDGVYTYSPQGQFLGFEPFRTPPAPRADNNRQPFETLVALIEADPNLTPEQKTAAIQQASREAMRMQWTNVDDKFRPPNPRRNSTFAAQPVLDRATAAAYLRRANGDAEQARALAIADGYVIPPE